MEDLRSPNPVENLDTEPIDPAPIHIGGQGFAGGDAQPQRREVESILRVLSLEHGRVESWDAKEEGGPVPANDMEHRLRRGPPEIEDRLRADAHRAIHVVAD